MNSDSKSIAIGVGGIDSDFGSTLAVLSSGTGSKGSFEGERTVELCLDMLDCDRLRPIVTTVVADLKFSGSKGPCGFESRPRQQCSSRKRSLQLGWNKLAGAADLNDETNQNTIEVNRRVVVFRGNKTAIKIVHARLIGTVRRGVKNRIYTFSNLFIAIHTVR